MAKTIVGVFDDMSSAQSVVRELQGIGVQRNHVRLLSNDEARTDADDDRNWTDKVSGWFSSLFDGDDDDRKHANHYAEAWRRGHYLVVADVESSEVDQVVTIMNRYGTVDLNRRTEQWASSGYTGAYDEAAAPYTSAQRTQELASYGDRTESAAIPVVQEELAVGKRVVQRGGVRIHSYVEERPVEEVVRLREERVSVQRRPVNRAAEPSDAAFQERTLEVSVAGEEAVVEKRARVVEEVVVGKEVDQRDETIEETVRRKDVRVEQVPGSAAVPESRR